MAGRETSTFGERVALWTTLVAVGSLLAMPLSVSPTFLAMATKLEGPLPALAALVLTSWFPPLLALPAAVSLGFGWKATREGAGPRRRGFFLLAAFLGMIALGLCLVGYSAFLFAAPAAPAPV